jgi:hypothetical protein
MAARRTRPNGEGSIFPYRNGFAAHLLVVKPDGKRGRKWIYGRTREAVHDKWIKLHAAAKAGPVATKVPTLAEYVTYWLNEIVRPNLAPGSGRALLRVGGDPRHGGAPSPRPPHDPVAGGDRRADRPERRHLRQAAIRTKETGCLMVERGGAAVPGVGPE